MPKSKDNELLPELTDFHLNKGGLLWQSPRQHPRITEARPQKHGHDEEKKKSSKNRNGRRQMDSQVRASEMHKKTQLKYRFFFK